MKSKFNKINYNDTFGTVCSFITSCRDMDSSNKPIADQILSEEPIANNKLMNNNLNL